MDQNKIGKFISELRKEKELTQEQLASKIGITKNAVSKWERGISMMDVSLLQPVCDILDISIVELLNGERINHDDIKSKTDDTIKNTINYSKNKIKKNRLLNVAGTVLVIFLIVIGTFFGYKVNLLNKYTLNKPNNINEVVSGLKNMKEIKVYKRTLPDDEYLILDNFKIKNDFEDYEFAEHNINNIKNYYQLKKSENGNNFYVIFGPHDGENNIQMIDIFADDVSIFGAEEDISLKFNSADRKYFLLKNDINNDIDFYKYVADNYYKENNIFMDKRTIMENYAFNTFVSISVPMVNEFIVINGDYQGYVFKIIKDDKILIQVTIIRDGKTYGFMTNDPKFKEENYLINLLGTIEIR